MSTGTSPATADPHTPTPATARIRAAVPVARAVRPEPGLRRPTARERSRAATAARN